MEVTTTSVATPTISAIVSSTQVRGAPLTMMTVAPMKKMMRPVPRSSERMSRSGTSSVPQSLA